MATIFRVEKQKNYTVMSNHHLKNPTLSLKAKGLLSQMLSLPDAWDYSLKGLAKINKESVDAIRTAVWELEKAGYIVRSQGHGDHGKFSGIEYIIYETPQIDADKSEAQEQAAETDVGRAGDANATPENAKSLDTQGISPWLENPTSVENPQKVQPNISPRLDFPTSENPTSENPTLEQLNTKRSKYINLLNTQSISQIDQEGTEKTVSAQVQLDGQTDFTYTLAVLNSDSEGFEELLANCDLDCLPSAAQPLMRAALEKMYSSPTLKIRGVLIPQDQVRERLHMLNGDILQSIYAAYISANRIDKPIINRIDYLISMIYNNVVEEIAEQAAFEDDTLGTVSRINRGYEDPQDYMQSDNPAIRFAAKHKAERENSG